MSSLFIFPPLSSSLSDKCNGHIVNGCSLTECYVHVTSFLSLTVLSLSLPLPPSLLLLLLWSPGSVDIGYTCCTIQLLLTPPSTMVCILRHHLILPSYWKPHLSRYLVSILQLVCTTILHISTALTLVKVPFWFMRINDDQFTIYFSVAGSWSLL